MPWVCSFQAMLRRSRCFWAKPHIREHDEQGTWQNLVAGLRSEESDEFAKFHWMEPAHFDYIVTKIDLQQ